MKATEKIRDTLMRRDREITDALQKLGTQAELLRNEQADVRRDMRALGLKPKGETPAPLIRLVTRAQMVPMQSESVQVAGASRRQLIVKALTEQFPTGATKSQIVEYIEQVRGVSENQNALSVYMNKLRKEELIGNKNQIWFLVNQEEPSAPTPGSLE
jgi:hypothetical protein